MMRKMWLFAALLGFLMVLPCAAETVAGLPLHVQTIAPGAVRVWVGDHVSSTAVSAIATRKGIVVIDTTNLPQLDEAFRKVIARELGRDDFRFLINTHGHGDHTNGNGVYADCQIIAEEQVPEMMRENFAQSRPVEELERGKHPAAEGPDRVGEIDAGREGGRPGAADPRPAGERVPEFLPHAHLPHEDLHGQDDPGLRRRHPGAVPGRRHPHPQRHLHPGPAEGHPVHGRHDGRQVADRHPRLPGHLRHPHGDARGFPGAGAELAGHARPQGRDQALRPRPLERRAVVRGLPEPVRLPAGRAGRRGRPGQGERRLPAVQRRLYPERQIPPAGRQPGHHQPGAT